jgi:hypothetical protein
MAKYQKSIDIWTLSKDQKRALQAGQWITAGSAGDHFSKGIWGI